MRGRGVGRSRGALVGAAVLLAAVGAAAVDWASQAALTREDLLSGARPVPTPFAVPTTPATDALPVVKTGGLEPVRRGHRSVPWSLIRTWDDVSRLAIQHPDTCDGDASVQVEETATSVTIQVTADRASADLGEGPCSGGARTIVALDRPLGQRVLLQAGTSDGQDQQLRAVGGSLAAAFDDAPEWPGEPWFRDGREVTRNELSLAAGPEHCGWQDAVYLGGTGLRAPRDQRGALWSRDPRGVLEHFPMAQRDFRAGAVLPPDARPTGYTQEGVELWTAPSDELDYIYLVNSQNRGDAERWVRGGGGCA